MIKHNLTRRTILMGLASSVVFLRFAQADEVVNLTWSDLLPETEPDVPNILRDKQTNEAISSPQSMSGNIRADWNGKVVKMPGYVLPLEYKGTGVVTFLLVPYVGACIHVPPPPANQLVLVTTEEPYEVEGLYAAVNVIGMFGTAATSTQFGETGYALSADKIEPYEV